MFRQKLFFRQSRNYVIWTLTLVLVLEQPLYARAAGDPFGNLFTEKPDLPHSSIPASSPSAPDGSAVNAAATAMKAAETEPVTPLTPESVTVPIFCEAQTVDTCIFKKTLADAEKNQEEIERLKGVDCNSITVETLMASTHAATASVAGKGAAAYAATQAVKADAAALSGTALKTKCQTELETQKAKLRETNTSINTDFSQCKARIGTAAMNCYASTKSAYLAAHSMDQAGAEAAGHAAREASLEKNMAALEKAHSTASGWVEKTTAFLEKYGLVMLAAIGAIVGLIMALSSSGKKKQDLFQNQNPNTMTKNPNTKVPNDNTKNGLPSDNTTEKNDSLAKNNLSGACGSDLKPLECFVSAGCDLNCVGDKYGVANYGGMDRDTTRIDKNGRAVDGSNNGNKNHGNFEGSSGSQAANTGGGGASGAGKIGGGSSSTPNAPGETGSSNSEGMGTRSVVGSGGGDGEGYAAGGGSGYGGGDGSGRGPANDRYKPGDIVTKSQALKNAMANGPILPATSNLFERIWTTTRNQCIRDEVICQSK